MNGIRPEVVEIQARMFANRLPIGQCLRRAGINASTWSRWVRGAEPKMSTLEKLNQAITAKINETDYRGADAD